MPALHVIAAGSLLQFALDKVGVPVGRVTFRWVSPLTFEEFLANSDNDGFLRLLEAHDLTTSLGTTLHQTGLDLLAEYMAVGGMPEVVNHLISKRDYLGSEAKQLDILEAFRNDFPKYANIDSNLRDVGLVFERAPHLVAQSFKFVHVSRDVQAKYIRAAISALHKAGVLNLVYQSHNIQAAASYNAEKFKLLFLDLGLVQRATNLPIAEWLKNRYALLTQGALAEQFIGQQLSAQGTYRREELYYWERNEKSSSAEVDFLVSIRDQTFPVEVKSGKHGKLRSLNLLLDANPDIPYAVKTSTDDFTVINRIRSVPLYAFGTWLKRNSIYE
jgi:predicted AAA+ superfamily ATPase